MTEEILWLITGDPYAPYCTGLHDSLFNSVLQQLIGSLTVIIKTFIINLFQT
jgi:hypothetical protein